LDGKPGRGDGPADYVADPFVGEAERREGRFY